MKKRLLVVVCFLVIAGIALAATDGLRKDFISNGARANLTLTEQNAGGARDGYQYNFALDKNAGETVNCYMLKYRQDDYEGARKYAERFIEIISFTEDEFSYTFIGGDGSVTIDKEINQIHFESAEASASGYQGSEFITDKESIQLAENFIQNRMLVLFYEEAQVHFDGKKYRVNFINRISNLKNYAFSNRIIMDKFGNILTLDYFSIQYDKVGDCNIKSMDEAFCELPKLTDKDNITLSDCQLVYIYDNSIIQPAYYFIGSAADDQTFECFVKAAVF
ncbi:MAG: hypothetical protein LBQ68_06675 [Clostridiales bacterium]|jgi:hypothetical protein|nr:hypothetical protein [Clostridiales bacterium]